MPNAHVADIGVPTQTLSQALGAGNRFGVRFNPLYAVGVLCSMQASLKISSKSLPKGEVWLFVIASRSPGFLF